MTPEKERIASGYDKIVEHIGLDTAFYDRCLAMHNRYTGDILDIGCGRGLLLSRLHDRAPEAQLHGLDISPKLCAIARENNPNAEIIQGDAEALPYTDDSFDTVFMTEALEHMLDYTQALAEVRRVLKPNGTFIVTVPNRDWASFDFYEARRDTTLQPVDDHYFHVKEIRALLANASLRILRYRGSDNLFYYEPYHRYEQLLARLFPSIYLKMKRLIFKCVNEKAGNARLH